MKKKTKEKSDKAKEELKNNIIKELINFQIVVDGMLKKYYAGTK